MKQMVKERNHRRFLSMCEIGDFEAVKELAEEGVDIHAENEYGLQLASYCGHLEIVKYLVENGSFIPAENNLALYWADLYGKREVANYLKNQILLKKLEAI